MYIFFGVHKGMRKKKFTLFYTVRVCRHVTSGKAFPLIRIDNCVKKITS